MWILLAVGWAEWWRGCGEVGVVVLDLLAQRAGVLLL